MVDAVVRVDGSAPASAGERRHAQFPTGRSTESRQPAAGTQKHSLLGEHHRFEEETALPR